MFWGLVRIGIIVILGAVVVYDLLVTVVFRERLYNAYTQRLDARVASGGPQSKIQSDVIRDCSELAVSQAGPLEAPMLFFDMAEYDFRSDVCFQVTVNRVYPQPRFQDPKMVALVCDSKNDLFRRLCQHAGLK